MSFIVLISQKRSQHISAASSSFIYSVDPRNKGNKSAFIVIVDNRYLHPSMFSVIIFIIIVIIIITQADNISIK